MKLHEFLADKPKHSNPKVSCNALYKKEDNLNCYLTATQAIEFARRLLEKAQTIIENKLDDTAVQVWNKGVSNEQVYFGLIKARVGPRKKAKIKKSPTATE